MRLISTMICRKQILLLLGLLLAPATLAQQASSGAPPLVLQPGTILTVRINQALSSDHNQPGDLFSGSLTQPVVVQGVVVAQSGQTVAGRVADAKKAGRVSGVSQLSITLTSLTLVDGQNVPIQSQWLAQKAPPSAGRDVAMVGGTTALGSLIGAAAGWGKGAAIGAGAGAAAGVIGVLLTRGYATVIYPETMLTFQVTAPVAIDTGNAPQAFHMVNPTADYPQAAPPPQAQEPPPVTNMAPPPPAVVAPQVVVAPPPYAYPYPYAAYYPPYPYYYPYAGYPYFYAPGIRFVFGYSHYPHYHGYPVYHGHYTYRGHYGPGYVARPVPHSRAVVVRDNHGRSHH